MLFYICLSILITLLVLNKKFKLPFVISSVVLMARYFVGADFEYYYRINTSSGRAHYFSQTGFLERFSSENDFYNLLSDLSIIIDSPRLPIILYGFFTMVLIFMVLKYQKYRGDKFLIYFAVPIFYLMSFSTISQHASIAFLLAAVYSLENRYHTKTLILIIFSIWLHDAIVIFLPFFIFFHFFNNNKILIAMQIVLAFTLIFNLNILQISEFLPEFKYLSYLTEVKGRGGEKIIYLFIPIVIIDLLMRGKSKYRNYLYLAMILFFFLAPLGPIAYRASLPFLLIYIFMTDGIFIFFNKNVFSKFVFISAVLAIFIYSVQLSSEHLIPFRIY